MKIPLILAALAMTVAWSSPAYAQAPEKPGQVTDSCWGCHRDDKAGRDHRAGIHYAFGIGCADCHGGDPTKAKREEAESEKAGFKAGFSPFDIPELCAKCHGKSEFVKRSRMKRNPFEEYKQGAHAEALSAARANADELYSHVAKALEHYHAAVEASGAEHLRVELTPPRLDEKHVRSYEFDLRRGRHRGLFVLKSRGELMLVGPFRTGKAEGPCRSFPIEASAEIESALVQFVSSFLEEAATP